MIRQISRNGRRAASFEHAKPLAGCHFLDESDRLNLLNQRDQHSLNLVRLLSEQMVLAIWQQTQVMSKQQVIFKLPRRSHARCARTALIPHRIGDRCPRQCWLLLMLAPIDDAQRRICDVSPNNSSLGNSRVARYMSIVNKCAFAHTRRSLKSFTRRLLRVCAVPWRAVGFHACSSLAARSSQRTQKLFTKFFPGSCRIFPFSSNSNRAAKISEDDISPSSISTS